MWYGEVVLGVSATFEPSHVPNVRTRSTWYRSIVLGPSQRGSTQYSRH